jgi:hypothetical protein
MIAAEEIVGPGRGLVQTPVSGWNVTFFERILLAIRFEPVVGPDVNAPFLPWKNFAPPFCRASTLAVEEKFRTL